MLKNFVVWGGGERNSCNDGGSLIHPGMFEAGLKSDDAFVPILADTWNGTCKAR